MEWLSAEEMHEGSLLWFSELNFARDEIRFLNDLIQTYTPQLTDSKIYERSSGLVGRLIDTQESLVDLMKQVQLHENQLEIMVDKVDQLKMEKAYVETHKDLTIEFNRYKKGYLGLKRELFKLLAEVLKKEKQKRLLN